MRALILALVALVCSAQAALAATPFTMDVPVLMYHRIACTRPDGTYSSLFICPEQFDAQMTALEQDGWHSITAGELADAMLAHACLPPKTFVITIDDGALDGYTNGAPIMEAHGFRATFAIVVGKVGYTEAQNPGKPHFVKAEADPAWDRVRDLVARGFEMANHTWFHASVRKLGATKLRNQVLHASTVMQEQTGIAPKVFVYPYGSFSAASAAGLAPYFEMAFTTQAGGTHSDDTLMTSPRVRVSRSTTATQLLNKMKPYAQPCREVA